jgi:hypothetical protein
MPKFRKRRSGGRGSGVFALSLYFVLRCEGGRQTCHLNGVLVFDVDVNDWPVAGKNPDGTPNKIKVAIKDKPRIGRIGLQNHGQVVWFNDIRGKSLK